MEEGPAGDDNPGRVGGVAVLDGCKFVFEFVVLTGFSKLGNVSGEAWLADEENDEELEGNDEHEGSI